MTWTAYVEQDGDDLVVPLPEQAMKELGWKPGTIIVWEVQPNGSIILRKKPNWFVLTWRRIREYFKIRGDR